MGLQTARLVLEQNGSAVIVGQREAKTEAARGLLSKLGPVESVTADLASVAGLQQVLQAIDRHRVQSTCSLTLQVCLPPSHSSPTPRPTTTPTPP